jgi:hypothetical protein
LLLQVRATAYVKPLYRAFVEFCKGKAMKEIKNTNNQRTFRPQIPGRAAMAILASLRPGNIGDISLGNMIMTVEIGKPSSLDWILGGCVSEMDFRDEGFCIIRLHGPIMFKWEMCVSEEGHGPVEGILSVTVGGWSATDRFGLEVVKQCMDPRLAKKRRVSGGSAAYGQRNRVGGKLSGSSNVQAADENSHPSQAGGSSASTKEKGMRYTARDRMERYQRRTGHGPGTKEGDILLKPRDDPCDDVVEEV